MDESTKASIRGSEGDHEVSEFVHLVAHELQNPLSSVTMMLSILRGAGDRLGPPFDDYIERAMDASSRMRELIRELVYFVDIGRIDREFESVDTGAVLREVLAGLDDEAAARVTLAPGPFPQVRGEPSYLRKLFASLIDNALRYRGDHEPAVRVSCQREDDAWEFCVSDNGIGIPEDSQGEVFDPLVRLHRYEEIAGTGLGLSICRRIAECHSGGIELASRAGEGTDVTVRLPAGSA